GRDWIALFNYQLVAIRGGTVAGNCLWRCPLQADTACSGMDRGIIDRAKGDNGLTAVVEHAVLQMKGLSNGQRGVCPADQQCARWLVHCQVIQSRRYR